MMPLRGRLGAIRYHHRPFQPVPTMYPIPAKHWLLTVVVLLTGGCVSMPDHRPTDSEAAARAESLYRDGELEQAARAFLALADRSGSNDASQFRLRAAEALRDNGNLAAASQALDGIQRRRLAEDGPQRLDLLDAEIALSRGDATFAEDTLRGIDVDSAPHLRLRVLELRARAQQAAGQPLAAARTRASLDRWLKGIERESNREALLAALATVPAEERARRSQELPRNDALQSWLVEVDRDRTAAASPTLRPLSGSAELVGTPSIRPMRIALLLPTSGQLATVAASIRDGFFTAYFADSSEQRPVVSVHDSGGSPESAAAAYQRAVGEGADRIVGPLQRDAVARLFTQPLPVPVIALNHPDGGVAPPAGSAEFGLPPESEGLQVAERMLAQGIVEASIFHADAEWADRAARAFRQRFEQGGGHVAGEARLGSREVNHADAIRSATLRLPAPPTTPVAPPPDTGSAPVSAAGIFISLLPQQARLLVPQLKIAGLTVPIYATSHLYGGDRNVGLDRDLDGVEFADAPWLLGAIPGKPDRGEITNQIASANGIGARLFALGMDAYLLVGVVDQLIAQPGQYVDGATGQLSADAAGHVTRTLSWARFEHGVARPSLGALTSQLESP